MDFIKGIFNVLADPRLYFLLMVLSLVFIVWKRELLATKTFGYGALLFFTLFFALGGLDPNFRLIITKPDNVPIVGLIFLLVFFTWYSMREAVLSSVFEVGDSVLLCCRNEVPSQSKVPYCERRLSPAIW